MVEACEFAVCSAKATVIVSWPSSAREEHSLCHSCAKMIFETLKAKFSGTEAFMGFTIMPLEETRNESGD